MAKQTSDHRACGCFIGDGKIHFCRWHTNAPRMMKLLSLMRDHYRNTPGMEECPFVQKIDELVPPNF